MPSLPTSIRDFFRESINFCQNVTESKERKQRKNGNKSGSFQMTFTK